MSDLREFPMEFEGGPQMVGPCDLRPQREDFVDRAPEPRAVQLRRVEHRSEVAVIGNAVGMLVGRLITRQVETELRHAS